MNLPDHRPKLLVIDDDPVQRTLLLEQLGSAGYDVCVAENGADGLEATRSITPDLVFCDWVMPGLDGPGYCRIVKSDPELQATYVTMLTGRDSTEDRVSGLDAGADDFLVKPIRADELLARARAGLRITQLRQSLAEAQHRAALLEMAAALGHEINNPLTALFGHLELARQHVGSDPSRVEHHLRKSAAVGNRIAEVAQRLGSLREPRTKPYLDDLKMLDLDPPGGD